MNQELIEKIANVIYGNCRNCNCELSRSFLFPLCEKDAESIYSLILSHFQGAGLTEQIAEIFYNSGNFCGSVNESLMVAKDILLLFEAEKQAAISEAVNADRERIKKLITEFTSEEHAKSLRILIDNIDTVKFESLQKE